MSSVVLSMLLGLTASSASQMPDDARGVGDRYEAAASAYARGEAKVASSELWLLAHTLDHPSWQLRLDTALAAQSAGEPGRAVAAARQALRIRPFHRLATETHEAAQRARGLSGSLSTDPALGLATLSLGPDEHLWLLLALYALTALALGTSRLLRAGAARVALAVFATATSLVAAAYVVRWATSENAAVVIEASATVRMGPSLDALTRFELDEAQVAEWLEVRGEFVRIRDPERGEGWVPRTAVELIDR